MHSLPYWLDAVAMDYARHLVGDQSRKTVIRSVFGVVQGPSGARLQLKHGQRGSHSSLDEVGHLLLNICSCTPQVMPSTNPLPPPFSFPCHLRSPTCMSLAWLQLQWWWGDAAQDMSVHEGACFLW